MAVGQGIYRSDGLRLYLRRHLHHRKDLNETLHEC